MYNLKEIVKETKELSVLYVEDDKYILKETCEILENFFLSVETAVDGEDGLSKYVSKEYDLIITDIKMPKKNGIEMIREIKKLNFSQSIIVTSAHQDTDSLIELIGMGVSNFILKPISSDSFFNAIQQESKRINSKKIEEKYLIEQSKLANLGQMIDIIAHQWLTPLTILKGNLELLKLDNDDGLCDIENINAYVTQQQIQLTLLLETLQEFRNFFRPNPDKTKVAIKELIESGLFLVKDLIKKENIALELHLPDDLDVVVIVNEFKQVLLTLLNNSIEIFLQREIKERRIMILGQVENDHVVLQIIDNGGGINDDVCDKIFERDFTTKENGTGVGLYLAKKILNKIEADISAQNSENGLKIEIIFAKNGGK